MSRHLDLYCCLPHEFLIAYPQLQSSFNHKKKKIHRNTHALEPTSSSSSQLSKCKTKNLLHPYKISKDHYPNDMHISRRGITNRIMSIESSDHEIEFYMAKKSTKSVRHHHSLQMADGDKKPEKTLENFIDQFQQHQEHITDIIRPVPCKPAFEKKLKQSSDLKSFKSPISHLSSSRIYQPTLSLNRTSTWRKLQANITPSHYNHIQQFQRERRQQQQQQNPLLSVPHPIMLSPLNKQSEFENSENSKIISNVINSCTSVSIDSSTILTDSNSSHRNTQSINEDQQILDGDDDDDNSNKNITIENEVKLRNTPSLEEIEEFQPVTDILSPSQVPSVLLNDILSSFFPTLSTQLTPTSSSNNNPIVYNSQHHTNPNVGKTPYMLFDSKSEMTELLLIDQPSALSSSFIKSEFISGNQQSKKVHSLFESIEELCLLIRKLLQHQLTEQKITFLQATIANQLAILLTYLAIPNNEKIISELIKKDTIERMTSTDEDDISFQKPLVLTIGTQTDLEWTQISKSMLESSNNLHFHTKLVHDLVDFGVHQSSSYENKQEAIIDIPPPSSFQKVTSHTELMSTSVTLHLPGRRLNHTLSDTFIYHHHQQYSSSYHKLISFSETTIHSLMHRWSTKEKTKYLLKHIGEKFQHFIELESSNTCLEASTEFTPDFLLKIINTSKYEDDDQTEQFGIDTEKQDYHTDTISLIINKNQDKIDTLTFNSTEKENYDSLELDIEHDNEEYSLFTSFDIHQSNQHLINESNIEEDDIPKSSITDINSLFVNNNISMSLNDNLVSPIINQLNNKINFCQLAEPHLNTYQWQLPILPRKTNSIDLIYEKQTAKIDFKHMKIRSNSNSRINIIGKRIRIKADSSSRASKSALNYNNNYNEHVDSTSIVDSRFSSTSIDSLNYSQSNELILDSSLPNIHQNRDTLVKTASSSVIISSHWSDVNGKLDSNIVLAETLLNMLDSLNTSSTMKIDLVHMYIRQFLVEFDARIRFHRERKTKKLKK